MNSVRTIRDPRIGILIREGMNVYYATDPHGFYIESPDLTVVETGLGVRPEAETLLGGAYVKIWSVDKLHAILNGKATPEEARQIACIPYLIMALQVVSNCVPDDTKGTTLGTWEMAIVRSALAMTRTKGPR